MIKWRRQASHLGRFTSWHYGCRATHFGRFTLWHNGRRNLTANFWKMSALDDSANTDRCTLYEDSANFLKDDFTKLWQNIRPQQTFERWTPRTHELTRELAHQSEAKRKQAPQSEANVCRRRRTCNLEKTSLINCTGHPITHRTPNTNYGLRSRTTVFRLPCYSYFKNKRLSLLNASYLFNALPWTLEIYQTPPAFIRSFTVIQNPRWIYLGRFLMNLP